MDLLTPQEWVDLIYRSDRKTCKDLCDQGIWVNGTDLLSHMLKADATNTFFKARAVAPNQLAELDEDIQRHSKGMKDRFSEIEESSFYKVPSWNKFLAETGDQIDLDRYIDRVPLCFTDRRKRLRDKPAVSVIFDTGISWAQRRGTVVKQRHEYIYQVAFEAEAEGRPCRVIAVGSITTPEVERINYFVVIKDYLDPIFPGLWGAFVSNRSTNSFLNCFMDYFIGTRDWCNGASVCIDVSKYIMDEELTIPYPEKCVSPINIWRENNKRSSLPDAVNF